MEDALVIAAEVAPGTGVLGNEPVTTAVLRDDRGLDHTVRIVGGPTKTGGFAWLAGHVVPTVGARVPLDLKAPRQAASDARWRPNTPSGTWPAERLREGVTFELSLPSGRDLGSDALGELDVAARTWGRVACTSVRAHVASGEDRTIAPADDGVNAVFFHDDGWPAELLPGVVGQTVVHVDGTGKIHDTDIHLNGTDFRFSNDGLAKSLIGAAGAQDARSVLVHEIGHALGLGHSDDPRATMSVSGAGRRWRSLERDDVGGICSLYPRTGSGAVASCDDDPCPTGFTCVAGACRRPGERADLCSPCEVGVDACEGAGDDARCIDIVTGQALDASHRGNGGVCGRPCSADADCGAGFGCRATTEAGDRQCVSTAGCTNGANGCMVDADCMQTGAVCREHACAGRPDAPVVDAGVDGDIGADGDVPLAAGGGGGCDCRTTTEGARPGRVFGTSLAAALALAVLLRRREIKRR